MPKLIDLTGHVFGKLTVLGHAGTNRARQNLWLVKCECGRTSTVIGHHLRYGETASCGCSSPVKVTHGMRNSRVYRIWSLMLNRCFNPKSSAFPDYGGRGITVSDRWRTFENFLSDMGEPDDGMSIDRIDNNAGYSPENCRWADKYQQAGNKRSTRFVTVDGQRVKLRDYCRESGLNYKSIHQSLVRQFGTDSEWHLVSALTRRERAS